MMMIFSKLLLNFAMESMMDSWYISVYWLGAS